MKIYATSLKKTVMVFIDTHIPAWLYNGDMDCFTPKCVRTLNSHDIYISPICTWELSYVQKIGKITKGPRDIIVFLGNSIDLRMDDVLLSKFMKLAIDGKWTRDSFDRLIVAHAKKRNAVLISADRTIAKH